MSYRIDCATGMPIYSNRVPREEIDEIEKAIRNLNEQVYYTGLEIGKINKKIDSINKPSEETSDSDSEIMLTKNLLNDSLGERRTEIISQKICRIIHENNLQYSPSLLKEIFKYIILTISLSDFHI